MPLESKQRLFGKALGVFPGLHTLPPSIARMLYVGLDRMAGLKKIAMAKVETRSIDLTSSINTHLTIRTYYPSIAKPLKALVYFHGGGCVIGNLASHDRFCRYLAANVNVTVIAVDYRLAPKYKFPTAVIDALAAWNWINDNANLLAIDKDNIGTAGDSAGGYLAALMNLNGVQKDLPIESRYAVKFQALLYPMVDLRGEGPSYSEHTKDLILTRDLMLYFRDHYLNNSAEQTQPLASPLLAECLAQSPKTYLLTLEYDPLRDEGKRMVTALIDNKVDVTHQHFDDCMHSFISVARLSPRAAQASDEVCRSIHKLVHGEAG